jgi:hypothetical protein
MVALEERRRVVEGELSQLSAGSSIHRQQCHVMQRPVQKLLLAFHVAFLPLSSRTRICGPAGRDRQSLGRKGLC